MAYFRIGPKGTLSETVLWTNSSPTADFKAQTVTLSDDITNYKYLEFEYKRSKGSETYSKLMVEVSEFVQMENVVGNNFISIACRNAHTQTFGRFISYGSNTSVKFTLAYCNTTDPSAGVCVPTNIYGLK